MPHANEWIPPPPFVIRMARPILVRRVNKEEKEFGIMKSAAAQNVPQGIPFGPAPSAMINPGVKLLKPRRNGSRHAMYSTRNREMIDLANGLADKKIFIAGEFYCARFLTPQPTSPHQFDIVKHFGILATAR
jgi:hypothetical protein